MKAWWAALLIAAVAIAGCTSNDDATTEEPTLDADVEATETGTQTATSAPEPSETGGAEPQENETTGGGANVAPVADLQVDTMEGTAPLNVTFSLAVSDDDGDDVTWDLDFGDGSDLLTGTNATFNVTHTYAEGNFSAMLTVSDGTDSANVTVMITVAAAEAAGGPVYEDLWVVQGEDGLCHAKDAVAVGPIWLHDRPGEGDPYGAGFVGGGGTWVYEETNGIEGMQVSSEEGGNYGSCLNGDLLIF